MLQTLLPRKLFSSRWRWLWLALLLLAPLAYVLSIRLLLQNDHNAHIGFALDREGYITAARQHAASQGVAAGDWKALVIVDASDELYFFQRLHPNSPVWQYLKPVTIKVALVNAEKTEVFESFLDVTSRPFGFDRHTNKTLPIAPIEEPAARKLASDWLRQRPEAALIPTDAEPLFEERTVNGNLLRSYRWKWPTPAAPELFAETALELQGAQLMQAETRFRMPRGAAGAAVRKWTPMRITLAAIHFIVIFVLALFGIFRFVKRARQKEISTQRVVIVGALFALIMTSFIVLTDVAIYQSALLLLGRNLEFVILATSLLMFGVWGGLLGLAYGSGEGDIREAYPGKLTSLDALITGRIFSRNVGRAWLWGAVWACWLSLATWLVGLLWARNPLAGHEYLPVVMMLSRSPLLSHLLIWQGGVVQMIVVSLLLPLPWLRRRFKSERTVLILLALIAWIGCQSPEMPFRPWTGSMLFGAISAAVIVVAFVKFDLLTAMSALGFESFSRMVWVMYAQPAPALHRAGLMLLIAVVGLIVIAIFALFKGQWLRDEEVRPVYAGLLAERLSLQADVSAARVAQERLLPQTLPVSSAYSVAAACVPAHEVGGDFFDFYQPDSERLGVLVAEGGGRGLGSALTIAFAKGFLMPKLTSNAQGDSSPTESLRALQTRMSLMLDRDTAAEQNVGLAYAELDTTDGTLRYARFGKYPRALVYRKQSKAVEPVDEYEVRFSAPAPDDPPIVLSEGRASLSAGDSVILFTGGIAEAWEEKGQTPVEASPHLMHHQGRAHSADRLQHALFEEIGNCAKLVSKQGLGDDLTAVIIRME